MPEDGSHPGRETDESLRSIRKRPHCRTTSRRSHFRLRESPKKSPNFFPTSPVF